MSEAYQSDAKPELAAPLRHHAAPCSVKPVLTALQQLQHAGTEVGVRPGGVVVQALQPSQDVILVVAGVLRSQRLLPNGHRQIIALLRAGDLWRCDSDDPRGVGIEASTMGRIRRICRAQFDALLERDDELRKLVQVRFAERHAAAQDFSTMLRFRAAESRVAGFLLMLSRHSLLPGSRKDVIWWPMSLRDMGDCLGLSKETVCRTLSRMRRAKVIRAEPRDRMRLLDLACLTTMVAAAH